MMTQPKIRAILLLGPTGAGKSPLGDAIEASGLNGIRCHHFDFGENLRKIAKGDRRSAQFDPQDIQVVKEVLTQGRLLENDSFYIARKILNAFIEEREIVHEDLIIMNGLPRHIGQARDTDQLVNVTAVVSLECTPETVTVRIAQNTGGDRTGRQDDSLVEVKAKLKLYNERTRPLVQHYIAKGTQVHLVEVSDSSTPDQVHGEVSLLIQPKP